MKAFILRSEVLFTSKDDEQRRAELLSELTDADLDQVGGASFTSTPTWNNSNGGDSTNSNTDATDV